MDRFPKDGNVYTFGVEADCKTMLCSLIIAVNGNVVARERVSTVHDGVLKLTDMVENIIKTHFGKL